MEEDRRDQEKGKGHHECQAKELGADAHQGEQEARKGTGGTHAAREELEHEEQH